MKMKLLVGMGLAISLGACATMPPSDPALEAARAAVQSAQGDPAVNRYAALDLDAAKRQLDIAETAYQQHKYPYVDHPAYLATQNARLAQLHAAAKVDDAHVAEGQTERDRIMLMARTREAENAKLAAATAKQEANTALVQRDQANEQRDLAAQQRDQANQEMARVQAELDALKATPTPRGMVLTLGDVLFDTGRSELKPGAARKLDQLGQFLTEHSDRRIQIDGFTDSVGTDAYNQELSQRRADAVKSALMSRGVDATRIGTEGYGKAYPVASNTDSGGRQLNRRVEVVIGNNGSPIAPRS